MANKKIQATATLFLDTKDAQNDAAKFVKDIKQQLLNIETAADKMTVFKDMVEYIAQIDKALSALKSKNADAFNKAFGGLDVNLKQATEMLMGVSSIDIGNLDIIRTKIEEIANSGKKTGHNDTFKQIAKDLNNLYRAMGYEGDKLNLDNFSGSGKFEQKLKLLTDAVEEFGLSFGDISDRIANSFGLEGATNVSKFGQKIREELLKINSEVKEIDLIKTKLSDLSNMKVKVNGLLEISSNLDDSVMSAEELITTMTELHNKLQDRELYTSDVDYYKDYVKYMEVAKKIKAFEATPKGRDFLSKQSGEVYDISLEAIEVAEEFASEGKSQILDALDTVEATARARAREVRLNIMKELGFGSGTGSGDGGSGAQKQTVSYQKLIEKMQEINRLQDDLDTNLTFGTDDYNKAEKHLESLKQEFIDLYVASDKAEDALDILNKISVDGMIDFDQFAKLCNMISVDMTSGFSAASNQVESFGQKIVNVSEYVSALSGQLKEMFATAGRSANFEYHIAIDGLDIKARHGSEKSVDLATQTETYLDTLFSESAIYGHSHRGGTAATNIYDIESVLSSYRDGVAIPVHFVVGKDAITTMDFTGLSQDMADQLMQEIASTNSNKNAPVINENINKIVEKFTGKSGALKTWNVEQFDDLAKYIYDVSSAASSALTPIEKFQAVLDNMFGKGKVDATKYESLLSGLDKDNAKSIFNQIASMEKLQPIKTTDMLTMGQVNAEIDESIAKYKTLREEANLSYSDIRNEVDKVIEHYNSGGSATSGLDFFQKYFPEGEWQNVRNLLTDAYDNLISIEEVTNRIASEFGVDPDTFAQIPNGVQTSQINDAKAKVEEFLAFADKMQHENLYGSAENNVDIGRYIERLETAKTELEALGAQGLVTAEDLEKVNLAFAEATSHLESETSHYDSYYNGPSYDYYDKYKEQQERAESAEGENTRLQRQLDTMRQLSDLDKQIGLTYDNNIDELDGLIEERKTLLDVAENTNSLSEEDLQTQRAITREYEERAKFIHEGYDAAEKDLQKDLEYLSLENMGELSLEDIDGYINRLNIAYSKLEEAFRNNLMGDADTFFENIEGPYLRAIAELEIEKERFQKENNYPQQKDVVDSNEVVRLEALQQKLLEVKTAVDAKTQAFEEEYVTVDAAVDAEIASLNKLKDVLTDIQEILRVVFSVSGMNIGDVKLTQGKDNVNAVSSAIQGIQQTLGQILAVLQGFTGLEADGKNSIKHKEGTTKTPANTTNTTEHLTSKLSDLATEGTLKTIPVAIDNLADAIAKKTQSESDTNTHTINALDTLISALNSNIKSLQDVMNGVVQYQKAQKGDTTKAMARIQDPEQFKQISSIAENSVGSRGTDVHIKGLKALSDGLVGVEGAFKNTNGEWEGFTVKVTESNAAVGLAINKYSAFAKVMSKLEEEIKKVSDAADNRQKLSPEDTANHAIVEASNYDDDGKEVTVQYKDSQRYTVSIKENIGGLQKEVFQTFDDSIKDFNERTTVTVSNKTTAAIRETNKLIEENAQKVGNSNLLKEYNAEYAKLLNMNNQYRYNSNLSDDDIDTWNKQITLVQTLGNEVSGLIKQQQKLDNQSGVATSAAKLQEYQANAKKVFDGLDFGFTSENKTPAQQAIVDAYSAIIEKVSILKKSHSVLTDEQIAELNTLLSTLKNVASAYQSALSGVFTSKRGEALSKFNLEKATLQADINIPDNFNDRLNQIKTAIESAVDDDGLKTAINDWKALQNEIKQAAVEQDLYKKKKPDEFTKKQTTQVDALDKYIKDLNGANYGVENLSAKLEDLKNKLLSIDNQASLDGWITEFEQLQSVVDNAKTGFVKQNDTIIDKVQKQLSGSFNRLDPSQQINLLTTYSEVMGKLAQQKKNVQNGQAVTLAGIQAITKALQEQIEVELKKNKVASTAEQTQKKNGKFGSTAEINAIAKHNSLTEMASGKQFENSSSIAAALNGYETAYEKFTNELKNLRNSNDQVTKEEEANFKKLTTECNNAASALEKVIKNTMELKSKQANTEDYMLGADFVDDEAGRAAALSEFVKKFYDVDVAVENFRNNYNEVVFTVDKGNGTFVQMAATFTDARNEIVALAGDTNKVQSKFNSFIDGVKSRLQSLSQYFIATVGIYDVWNVVKQGINHVREIDSAMTELKKVTDATDASYDQFLQDMSKTGAVIGATVKDLTTMSAEWARLGYSMEEAGKLAESTAILLNVSEFQDATAASEALISTMQAFQYTADESGHVVDILNEVKFTCLRV